MELIDPILEIEEHNNLKCECRRIIVDTFGDYLLKRKKCIRCNNFKILTLVEKLLL